MATTTTPTSALAPAVLHAVAQSPLCLFLHWTPTPTLGSGPAGAALRIRLTDTSSGATVTTAVDAPSAAKQYVYVDAAGRALRAELLADDDEVVARAAPVTMPRLQPATTSGSVSMRAVDGHDDAGDEPGAGWLPVSRVSDLPVGPPAEWLGDGAPERLARRLNAGDGVQVTYDGTRRMWRGARGESRIAFGPWRLDDGERKWSVSMAWQSAPTIIAADGSMTDRGAGREESGAMAHNAQRSTTMFDPPGPHEWLDAKSTREGERATDAPPANPPGRPLPEVRGQTSTFFGGSSEQSISSDQALIGPAGSRDFPLVPPGATLLQLVPPTRPTAAWLAPSAAGAASESTREAAAATTGGAATTAASDVPATPFAGKGPAEWLDEAGGGHDNRDLNRGSVAAPTPTAPAAVAAPIHHVFNPVPPSTALPIPLAPVRKPIPPEAAERERKVVTTMAVATIALALFASFLVKASGVVAVLLALGSAVLLGFTITRRRATTAVPQNALLPSLAIIAVGLALALVFTLALAGMSGPLGVVFITLVVVAEWAIIRPLLDPPDDPADGAATTRTDDTGKPV
ncbi:MAG: hypothetical protein AB7K09_05235 [Planctomycetota bacterium]